MVKSNHLKLYNEPAPPAAAPALDGIAALPHVISAFEAATGWSLRCVLAPSEMQAGAEEDELDAEGDPAPCAHLRLAPAKPRPGSRSPLPQAPAQALATALAGLLGELLATQHALWLREAELAAGVPLVPAADESENLARRLQAAVQAGAQAVGCDAAALYLLDEGTSQLKLRSAWGLPASRLIVAPRSLRGAAADLEALLGHAVVLDSPELVQHWKSPEDFPLAVCVPVGSATTILGTYWVFGREVQSIDARHTGLLEIVAGRLALELERSMLLREGIQGARLQRQVAAAAQLQRDQLPGITPQIDGWDLAGWAATPGDAPSGQFFDWFALDAERVAIVLASAVGTPIEAALTAAAVRAAVRAHGVAQCDPALLLREVNRTLWTSSAGGQHSAIFYAVLGRAGQLDYATAGPMTLIAPGPTPLRLPLVTCPLLGETPDGEFPARAVPLLAGEGLLAVADDLPSLPGPSHSIETELIDLRMRDASPRAAQTIGFLRGRLESLAAGQRGKLPALLLARRTTV